MSLDSLKLIKPVFEIINREQKVVVILGAQQEADEFYNLLTALSPILSNANIKPILFVYDEYEPFMKIPPVPELCAKKIESLSKIIISKDFNVLIIPYKALFPKTIPYEVLKANLLILKKGDNISQKELIERLVRNGYKRDNIVDMSGKFSVRGEIVDVFAVNQKFPARIVMLGSIIEKIRLFDIETQRGFKEIDSYFVVPSNEFIIDDNFKNNTIENIKHIAAENGLPARKIKEYIDELDASFEYNLKNHYLPFMYNYGCSTFIDYIKASHGSFENIEFLCGDKDILKSSFEEYYQLLRNNYVELFQTDRILPPFETLVADRDEIDLVLHRTISVESEVEAVDVETLITKFKLFLKKDSKVSLEEIRAELLRIVEKYSKVVFFYVNDEQKRGFVEILNLVNICYSEDFNESCKIILRRGNVSGAFLVYKILFFSLKGIFKEKKTYEYEESIYDKIKMLRLRFSEIRVGDYVVHRDFGIGIYRGLKKMSGEGGVQDYIVIEYRDNRMLYLPALNIDMINKYESAIGKSPSISPLGKEQWQRKKIKIKEELLRFASEILRIKAQRRLIEKEPIKEIDDLNDRFAAGFEFEETPDQLRCIEEVKRDLMSNYPMERIVCGDVGFGKTEIIMRAAFMVASNGYQVAILVPTTILAEQHYFNFKKRLSEFPIKVEMLSRFVSDKDAKRIVREIREGKVDIIIGTHKMLTGEVQFKNIRLLVIDEEHKFGVEQKERLKRQNPALDILITTATPIPRTLHMGFSNLIDLSVLTTPPQGRIPVRTIISRFDEDVIRNAIFKEVNRGGQVFFVNPRIKTIDSMAKKIKSLLPDLRVAIAHGRMPSETIEDVMHNFFERRYDLLVSTNIIGSGLDFPNVNTIIVDSADLFGLAELYQLRGRVGRGKINAYAYFLFPTLSGLTKEQRKKIDILYRHQGLGAGFNIASEDLELRGAGELLGKRQAGFIEGIGYDLYHELLQDAISEIQGVPITKSIETEIRLDIPVSIPDEYIDDVALRLNFYHRFSMATTDEVIDNLLYEMEDRFGKYPDEVKNLAELSRIKILAKNIGIREIEKFKSSVSMTFDISARIRTERIVPFMEKYHKHIRISPNSKVIINYNDDEIFSFLRQWLLRLGELIQ
ncbi:MAG: transcription-repair coupling factor [Myxococcota bacterium]